MTWYRMFIGLGSGNIYAWPTLIAYVNPSYLHQPQERVIIIIFNQWKNWRVNVLHSSRPPHLDVSWLYCHELSAWAPVQGVQGIDRTSIIFTLGFCPPPSPFLNFYVYVVLFYIIFLFLCLFDCFVWWINVFIFYYIVCCERVDRGTSCWRRQTEWRSTGGQLQRCVGHSMRRQVWRHQCSRRLLFAWIRVGWTQLCMPSACKRQNEFMTLRNLRQIDMNCLTYVYMHLIKLVQ